MLDIHIWHRSEEKKNRFERGYKHLLLEEKESYRWTERVIISAEKYPLELEVYVVHVKEKAESVPFGEKPIEWTLYTSHPTTPGRHCRY